MLKPIREDFTIVIIGKWNVSIFTPRWLSENIFDQKEVAVEFPLEPGLPRRIIGEEVVLIPSSDRLALNVSSVNDENLRKMESKARLLLDILPHTPVAQIGTNIGYAVEDPDDDLFTHFPSIDSEKFADKKMIISSRFFAWTFNVDGQILNMKCNLKDTSPTFHFNFHSNIQSPKEAIPLLDGKILGHRSFALSILKEIYNLQEDMK